MLLPIVDAVCWGIITYCDCAHTILTRDGSIFGITNFIIIMVLCLFISTERIARGASYKPGGTDNGKSISDALGGFSWLQKLQLLVSR